MRNVRFLLAIFIAVVFAGPALAAEEVDLLLVLASDVSRSVDAAKFKLQRDGYVAALSSLRVIDRIRTGNGHLEKSAKKRFSNFNGLAPVSK